ncbi:MAG: hypothetical protein L6R40_002023 [Gallowayella cf. fulva]|nr:MAG: hypothetical protein L6R40_002023 [Xanthomendoza cf. fulva]
MNESNQQRTATKNLHLRTVPKPKLIRSKPLPCPRSGYQPAEKDLIKPIQTTGIPRNRVNPGIEEDVTTGSSSSGAAGQDNDTQMIFNLDMKPTRKRKRRHFSDDEKAHMKHVRKVGACLSCKAKKCKCTHVVTSSPDPPSPLTPDSEAFEPVTPESAYMPDPMGFSQDALVEEFGDFLNYDQL